MYSVNNKWKNAKSKKIGKQQGIVTGIPSNLEWKKLDQNDLQDKVGSVFLQGLAYS